MDNVERKKEALTIKRAWFHLNNVNIRSESGLTTEKSCGKNVPCNW